MRKIIAVSLTLLVALVLVMSGAFVRAAGATECVPHAAYDETVHHAAVTHIVHHNAVPGQWWNWSPDKNTGPFTGPPAFPTDPRGRWHGPHANGGPKGTGTYQTGKPGHGDWFHRAPGTPASDDTVIDKEAYDETVHHDAVTCDTQPPAVGHTEQKSGCDLSKFGDFRPGVIARTGTEDYVLSQGQWVLSGHVVWGDWTQAFVYEGKNIAHCLTVDKPLPHKHVKHVTHKRHVTKHVRHVTKRVNGHAAVLPNTGAGSVVLAGLGLLLVLFGALLLWRRK